MYSTEKTWVLMMSPLSSLMASEMMIKCSPLCRQWLQSQPHDNYRVSVHIDGLPTRVDRMGGRADWTDHNTIPSFQSGEVLPCQKSISTIMEEGSDKKYGNPCPSVIILRLIYNLEQSAHLWSSLLCMAKTCLPWLGLSSLLYMRILRR